RNHTRPLPRARPHTRPRKPSLPSVGSVAPADHALEVRDNVGISRFVGKILQLARIVELIEQLLPGPAFVPLDVPPALGANAVANLRVDRRIASAAAATSAL